MFEWDDDKNQTNIRKHGISFNTALKIFDNPVLTRIDTRQNYGEDRFISIGIVDDIAIIVVVHTDREGVTRLISARPAKRKERALYEEKIR